MECLNFALAFIRFQSFYLIAIGDNTTRGPCFLFGVARPFVESPQNLVGAGCVSAPTVSALRYLVTSAREEADSLLHRKTSAFLIGYSIRPLGRVAFSVCTLSVGVPVGVCAGVSRPGTNTPAPSIRGSA